MSEENDTTRRELLQKVGSIGVSATALGTIGIDNVEARSKKREKLLSKYQDESQLRRTFSEQTRTLENVLIDEGVVPADFSFQSVGFDVDKEIRHVNPETQSKTTQVGTTRLDDEQTAVILQPVETESHHINTYVQPERQHAYARVMPKDGGEEFMLYKDGTKATTASCTGYEECTTEVCDVNYGPSGPTHTFVKNWYSASEDSTGNCQYDLYSTTCSC